MVPDLRAPLIKIVSEALKDPLFRPNIILYNPSQVQRIGVVIVLPEGFRRHSYVFAKEIRYSLPRVSFKDIGKFLSIKLRNYKQYFSYLRSRIVLDSIIPRNSRNDPKWKDSISLYTPFPASTWWSGLAIYPNRPPSSRIFPPRRCDIPFQQFHSKTSVRYSSRTVGKGTQFGCFETIKNKGNTSWLSIER